MGLGLSIVRHLVELHDGTVHTASPGGDKGATFVIRLPLIASSEPSSKSQLPNIRSDLSGIKILLVDDDADT